MVVAGTIGDLEIIFSRFTVKISFTAQENAYEACINKLKAIFNTI